MSSSSQPFTSFQTERLRVGPWGPEAARLGVDLVTLVAELLNRDTTAQLPEPWRGDYDEERAERWVVERDGESPTLLVTDGDDVVGLLILFQDGTDLRLGYVIAGHRSGQGYATELVGGLVTWSLTATGIDTISGGVSTSNPASGRVLRRNGFSHVGTDGDELIYRRRVNDAGSM